MEMDWACFSKASKDNNNNSGLKVNDQLVTYATTFLAVRLKIMCGRTTTP